MGRTKIKNMAMIPDEKVRQVSSINYFILVILIAVKH